MASFLIFRWFAKNSIFLINKTKNINALRFYNLRVKHDKKHMEKYLDSSLSPAERAKDLLKRLSDKEKIEQMNCSGCLYSLDEVLSAFERGQDIVHGEWYWFKSFDLKKLQEMEEKATSFSRFGIPTFVSCENVHGGALPFTTIFPTAGCLGASFDEDLAYRVSKTQAKEIRALGFNKVYAPNLDLFREPRWGRCEENISEDPYLLSVMAKAIVRGTQEEGVMATPKHFLGYSEPEGGLNLAPTHMGEREMREYFLPSFKAAIEEGAMGLMTCYNVVDGVPVTISPLWMKKVLREELSFDGVTILDYGMSGIMKNAMGIGFSYSDLAKKLLDAGVDMEACEPLCYNEAFMNEIANDRHYLSLIDQAVYRILKAKFSLGLFENPSFDLSQVPEVVGTKEAFDLTYEEEAKGATLLKNNGILPLKKGTKILLVGPNATLAQLGGITYYAVLEDYKEKDAMAEKAIPTDQAFIDRFGKENVRVHKGCNFFRFDHNDLPSLLEDAKWADVIIFAGGNNSIGYSGGENGGKNNPLMKQDAVTSSEGYDVTDIGLTKSQKELFENLKITAKPMVFLNYGGKPISLEKEIDHLDAILFCYGVGMLGNLAICDILLGKINPSGRLPFTVARNVGQLPFFYNHYLPRGNYGREGSEEKPGQDYVFGPNKPLFKFGDGLSYSRFTYRDLKVKRNDEDMLVSVFVKNEGPMDGEHVLLLYGKTLIRDFVCVPAKRLVAFKRCFFKNGEEKRVSFKLSPKDFSYIGIDMKETLPKGPIEIEIGGIKINV